MPFVKLGHAHFKVRDLERAVEFYTRHLGLAVVERVGEEYAFLSSGDAHHVIALQAVEPHARPPYPHGAGLHYLAFEVPNRTALAEAYRALVGAGVPVTRVDHGIGWAIYFTDPDGNGLALYWDRRDQPDGEPLWRGQNRPLPEDRLLESSGG